MATALDMIQHDQQLQDYWVRRVFAAIIDAVLVLTPVYVFMGILALAGGHLWWAGGIISGFVWFAYSILFEIAIGATIGKILLGLKVVSTRGKLDGEQVVLRNLTKIFALLLVLDMLLAFVTETNDPHQRYMDRMANTALVMEGN